MSFTLERRGLRGLRHELRDISEYDNSVSGLSSKLGSEKFQLPNQDQYLQKQQSSHQFPQYPLYPQRLHSFSSKPSSPFASNNDLSSTGPLDSQDFIPQQVPLSQDYESKDYERDSEFDITDQADEMDKSIASLQKSLASAKINTSSLKSLNYTHKEEVSMDTTRYNETLAQLDRDIDLDSSDASKQSLSKIKQSPTSSTPWRKFRSSASSLPLNLPPAPQLRFGTPDINLKSSGPDTTSSETINELNKQLTGYKIQIRLFKQFLQKLIENNDINEDFFNSNELTQLQSNLNGFSPIGKRGSSRGAEFTKLESDYNELSKNYDEIYKLNEDLYVSLEDFQTKLVEKENFIKKYNQIVADSNSIIQGIIQALINDSSTDMVSKKALDKCLENCQSRPIDLNLSIIKMELEKRTDSKRASFSSSSSTKVADKDRQYEINNYIKTIHQLMATLEQLKNEFDDLKQMTADIQYELQSEIAKSDKLRSNYALIQEHLDKMTTLVNDNNNNSEQLEYLQNENQKLRSVNQTINNKFEEYQQIIDQLQHEVNEFKDSNHNFTLSELNEELLQSHRDFNHLQEEYNDLHSQYIKLKEDSSNTVSSLTNQLHNKKQETSSLRSDRLAYENLEQELNLAVEKQRVLKAEKVRLTYKVDSLTKDKISLQATIQNLTDKITDLTVSDHSRTNDIDQTLIKKKNILEYQIGELLKFDIVKFQLLMESFNKVNDDFSLKLPTRKLDYMAKKLLPNNSSNDSDLSGVDFTDMNNIRDYHKSVFDYIIRATKTVVDKYVTLYLMRGQETDYVNQLHDRIYQLSKMNDDLSKLMESGAESSYHEGETSIASPKSKLRIDELSNRWKAEREARVYENNEAKRRLEELEMENTRLIDQLKLYEAN